MSSPDPHQAASIEFRVIEGPSDVADHAAVVAEYERPFADSVPARTLAQALGEACTLPAFAAAARADEALGFDAAAVALARVLADIDGPADLAIEAGTAGDGRSRLVLAYHDAQATVLVARTALRVAFALFAHARGAAAQLAPVAGEVATVQAAVQRRGPDFIDRAMMRVARARGIPWLAVSPGTRVWRYGQGSAGAVFFESSGLRDSFVGVRLAQDKFQSLQWLRRLGLPVPEHALVQSWPEALEAAGQLGWPVVVKPVDGRKGEGVAAHVLDVDELRPAFEAARAAAERGVLVERHLPGEDHRIAVFGGRVQWVVRRSPPTVHGDGRRTVAELIEAENANRTDADVAAGFVARIEVDDDLQRVLAKQGLTLDACPEDGRRVRLRAIANTATGGTITDCTDRLHPDVRDLAETVARNFGLDALGLDFMTTDIAQSWRDVPGAVIEVNSTPGFSSDGRAEIILGEKIPPGSEGRVPTVVLVDASAAASEQAVAALHAAGLRVGVTDERETLLEGRPRCRPTDDLHARVRALLLDAACDAVVVAATSATVARLGFPLDRCALALLPEGGAVAESVQALVERCAARCERVAATTDVGALVAPLVPAAAPDGAPA